MRPVVVDVMGHYHPHGDTSIYDASSGSPRTGRCATRCGRQGNFGSPGNDPAAAPRYTECRMAPLAMEMVRDIDEETVDFSPNYDGHTTEPDVLPSRFPNLLVNGSAGIAVGMATNIPPHNLREVAEGRSGCWTTPTPPTTSSSRPCCSASRARTSPRAHRSSAARHRRRLPHRPRVDHHARRRHGRGDLGRTCLVVSELPYQVNPDNLAENIANLVRDGRLTGIADVQDHTSGRTGQRLVIILRRDAVAKSC